MGLGEFELIRRYFAHLAPTGSAPDPEVGIGDDGAVVRPCPDQDLVVTTDTLVAGVHFDAAVDPSDLGYKALAVNLSDLAAMGAEPAWFTLALTLPGADPRWLEGFARGLGELACRHGVILIGGDTTRGPLSLTITAIGRTSRGQTLRRSGAGPGDLVFVTGTLGDGALALKLGRAGRPVDPFLAGRLARPQPRLAVGLALRGLASAAIDVSDGLVADARHLCLASGVGAEIEAACLPLSTPARALLIADDDWGPVLGGGDDYELLFTVPVDRQHEVAAVAATAEVDISRIGRTVAGKGIAVQLPDGSYYADGATGFDHFAGT